MNEVNLTKIICPIVVVVILVLLGLLFKNKDEWGGSFASTDGSGYSFLGHDSKDYQRRVQTNDLADMRRQRINHRRHIRMLSNHNNHGVHRHANHILDSNKYEKSPIDHSQLTATQRKYQRIKRRIS